MISFSMVTSLCLSAWVAAPPMLWDTMGGWNGLSLPDICSRISGMALGTSHWVLNPDACEHLVLQRMYAWMLLWLTLAALGALGLGVYECVHDVRDARRVRRRARVYRELMLGVDNGGEGGGHVKPAILMDA